MSIAQRRPTPRTETELVTAALRRYRRRCERAGVIPIWLALPAERLLERVELRTARSRVRRSWINAWQQAVQAHRRIGRPGTSRDIQIWIARFWLTHASHWRAFAGDTIRVLP